MPIVTPEVFEEQLFAPESEIYDPEGKHHAFSQNLHGRKIDCDKILRGSSFYFNWIELHAAHVHASHPEEILARMVLMGIANGTNDVAQDMALALGNGVEALETQKTSKNSVELTEESVEKLLSINPVLVKGIEDVGTRGTNSSSGVVSVHQNRNPALREIEVSHTVLRGIPERLIELGIVYDAMIIRLMRDYTKEECESIGYCADDWELIPHGQ
jgi:hypothetical protein